MAGHSNLIKRPLWYLLAIWSLNHNNVFLEVSKYSFKLKKGNSTNPQIPLKQCLGQPETHKRNQITFQQTISFKNEIKVHSEDLNKIVEMKKETFGYSCTIYSRWQQASDRGCQNKQFESEIQIKDQTKLHKNIAKNSMCKIMNNLGFR